jgi:hypothetical protein
VAPATPLARILVRMASEIFGFWIHIFVINLGLLNALQYNISRTIQGMRRSGSVSV